MWFTWKLHATCNKSFCKVREKEREVRHKMTWWQAINSIRCKHDDQPYIDHTNNLRNCATFIPLSNIVRVTEFWRWFFSLFLSSLFFLFLFAFFSLVLPSLLSFSLCFYSFCAHFPSLLLYFSFIFLLFALAVKPARLLYILSEIQFTFSSLSGIVAVLGFYFAQFAQYLNNFYAYSTQITIRNPHLHI